MKIGDHIQNLGVRVAVVQAVAFILLALLGARLYYLQIVKGEYYSDRAESQRVRLIPIPAPRGAIFDRSGNLLVDSRPTYNVVLSNEPLKTINVNDTQINNIATDLTISALITGASDVSVTKIGGGTLQLSGANTFSGPFLMNGGIAEIGNNAAFGVGLLSLQNTVLVAVGGARTVANTVSLDGTVATTNSISTSLNLF